MAAHKTGPYSSGASPSGVLAGWRPIGTLPRDGRLVVLVNDEWGEGSLVVVSWNEDHGLLTNPSGRECYSSSSYTHWVEVPPLPRRHPGSSAR
jgi:hypothetical protein